MKAIKTLDRHLCQLADAADEHTRVLDLSDLLLQLWHHHVSMAKPQTAPASKEYNQELAARLAWHLGFSSKQPELKFKPGGREKTPAGKLSDAMAFQDKVTTRHILESITPWLTHHPTCKKIEVRRGTHNWEKAKGTCSCGLDKAMGVDQ